MEHRHYVRRSVSLATKLVVNGELLAVTRAVELSRGGARIINPGIVLRKNQIVEVSFKRGEESKAVAIKSMVIHSSQICIGLMFDKELPVDRVLSIRQREVDAEGKAIFGHGYIEFRSQNAS